MKSLLVLLSILMLIAADLCAQQKPTDKEVTAIRQAVEDEIYDYGYENAYVNVGSTGAISSPTDVPLFVSPDLGEHHRGAVIYKFMPFGEVRRRFEIRPDGLVVLYGNPFNRFPATQPDTNTLYLRDEDVCSFKQNAVRADFTVDPHVSVARRREAARRQQRRTGYSELLEKGSNRNR